MAQGLEFLNKQGLDKYRLICGALGGYSATIWMDRKKGFKSHNNSHHLRVHANRLLCSNCSLASSNSELSCDTINPNRQYSSRESIITSQSFLSLAEWTTLALSLPCLPDTDNDWNH